MADLVRVKNLHPDRPLRLAYNSQMTVINPGESGVIEREAACAHFGVWWSVEGGKPIDRKEEWLRIRGLYGCLPGAPTGPESPNWEEVKPRVQIEEFDGTIVSTVIDDQHGENLPVTERQDDQHLRETVLKMQEQLAQMESQLDMKDRIIQAGSVSELPAPDSPDSAPRRPRKSPEIQAARVAE